MNKCNNNNNIIRGTDMVLGKQTALLLRLTIRDRSHISSSNFEVYEPRNV